MTNSKRHVVFPILQVDHQPIWLLGASDDLRDFPRPDWSWLFIIGKAWPRRLDIIRKSTDKTITARSPLVHEMTSQSMGSNFFFLSPKRGELGGRIKPPRKGRIFCNNTMFHFICIQKYVAKKNMDSNFRLIKEFDFKYRLANDLYFLCGYTLVEQA